MPFEEAERMVAHPNYKEITDFVLARLRQAGYVDADIRVERAEGDCRGTTSGLPVQDFYLPFGSGISDPYQNCMRASTLNEHDDTYVDTHGRWHVVLNRNQLFFVSCDNTVVLVREKEGVSLVTSEDPPAFTRMQDHRILPVALTQAEFVYCEMRWEAAKKRKMDEVRGVNTFDQFVARALLSALDLNGISFKLRPLPRGVPDRELVPVLLEITGDDLFTHLRRLYQQLLPHLSLEERALLDDPRVIARTFCMSGLQNMLD